MHVHKGLGSASHRRRPGACARGPHGEKPVLHPAHVHCATPPKNAPAAPHPGCVSRTVPFSIALQVHLTRAGAHAHTSTYPPWVAGRRRTPPPPRPTLPAVGTRAGSSLAPAGCRPDRGWAGCACRPCPAECAPRPRRPWTHSSPWQAGVGLGRGLDWMRWLPTTKNKTLARVNLQLSTWFVSPPPENRAELLCPCHCGRFGTFVCAILLYEVGEQSAVPCGAPLW